MFGSHWKEHRDKDGSLLNVELLPRAALAQQACKAKKSVRMRSYGNLHRRLADITNLDLEHSCPSRDIDSAKAKTFPRVVLAASGVHGAAKQELQRLATSIGATYSGDLVLGVTTHLICKRLIDCFGSVKYQRALEWGIHVVTYEWLEASSVAGRPLPEHDYKDDKLQALKPSPRPVRRQQQAAQHCQQQPEPAAQCPGTTRHPSPAAVSATAPIEPAGQSAAGVADMVSLQIMHRTPTGLEPPQQQARQVKQHQQQQELKDLELQQGPQHSPTELQLSLDDLPQDFLIQGSEPEDYTVAAEVVDDKAGSVLPLNLSQYSLQQHREREQQQQQQPKAMPLPLSQHLVPQHLVPLKPGAPEPAFGFRQPTTPGSAEHASPCMQHFLPMHHHQQQQGAAAERSSPNIGGAAGSEIQAAGIPITASITARTRDGAADQQLNRVTPSSITAVVSGQSSSAATAGFLAAAGSPVSSTATASPAPSVTSDVSADEANASEALRLHLPETQADLEDPWGTAAAAGDTPISLKFYAQQLRSKTRTAGRGAEASCCRQLVQHDQQQSPLQQKHQQQEVQQAGGLYQQNLQTDESADDTDKPLRSGSTSDDDTEEPSSGSTSDLGEGPDPVTQQQHERHPSSRPWSASSSTACSQQQQQQPDFRLTQPSSSGGGSSRRCSGLTRLKRRDGFRRLGRVLVSQLPDSSEMELQHPSGELRANNCELEDSDCELPNSDCEIVQGDGLDDDILDDSDCEDIQQQQQQRLQQHHELQQTTSRSAGDTAGRMRHSGPTADSHSPVHSCSASSLPANTDSKASRPALSSKHPHSPTAGAAASPAASAVSGSSNGEMPVMKLHFSLANTTDVTPACSQQDGSVYTPSCDHVSSEYSPLATTGRAEASSTVVSENRLSGCVGVDEDEKEQQMQQDDDSTAVSAHSEQISGASRLAECKDTGAAAAGGIQEPQLEGDAEPAGAAGASPCFSETCSFITKRRGARGPGTVQYLQASPAPAGTVPSKAHIKQESEETSAERWLMQQQLDAQQHLSAAFNPIPADAMLRAMKQQQQQQQRHTLKPAPIKRERLTPAEHLLQDLRMRQQQQQHRQQAALIDQATEGIDDEADGQGHATHRPQQQQRLPRNSVASYATDISTASRKVPLKVLGVAEKVIGGDGSIVDGLAGSTTPLERLLQATLVATRRESDAAAAAALGDGDGLIKQEAAEWVHTPEGVGTTAEAAAAKAIGGGGGSEDDAFEITGLPTKMVAARNKAMTKQLDAHLAHLSQAGADQVIPLKLLSKAPRGSTGKAFHDIKSSSKLVYADQVQVPWAHATLSTKEKSRCAIVADTAVTEPGKTAEAVVNTDDKPNQDRILLAEPVAFYKLESGEWWLELLRFYSTKELRLLAKAADCKLHLPADYHLSYELLRGMTHEHVPMKLVQGEFKLSKVKKVPSGSRSRANPFFWRYSIDLATMQVLTDRPVTDYLIQ